ncbi:MAG: PspA/IM30 family protein [Bacteroidia bacterium]
MNTNPFPAGNAEQKLKSYWNRPGGKFGVLAGIGILVAIGYFVVPILTQVVWNTVNFGIALACLGIFLYCITHRKLRLSLYYLYEILMKKLVGLVIELDPFIIAEDYIQDMEKQRQKLYEQSVDVDAQKEKLNMKLVEKEKEMNQLLSRAQAAKENNMLPELGNATRQVARLQEYVKQLSPIRDSLARIGDYLTKVHKNSAYLIEDAKNELELKKDLYKSVNSGNKALSSALKIFEGDPEKKLMVEQSMEHLKEDIAAKLANIKKAISYSSDFMRSIDLDNATYEKDGLKMLDNFNPDTELKLNSSNNAYRPNETPTQPGQVNTNQYTNLLD